MSLLLLLANAALTCAVQAECKYARNTCCEGVQLLLLLLLLLLCSMYSWVLKAQRSRLAAQYVTSYMKGSCNGPWPEGEPTMFTASSKSLPTTTAPSFPAVFVAVALFALALALVESGVEVPQSTGSLSCVRISALLKCATKKFMNKLVRWRAAQHCSIFLREGGVFRSLLSTTVLMRE
jgi:hypothetical protein